jgi:pimeloyl-ACP methyl ester carboxylesterase
MAGGSADAGGVRLAELVATLSYAAVVHGERGDGGVTDEERRTLEACRQISVITIPGASYFTPVEEPALVAKLIKEALDRIR